MKIYVYKSNIPVVDPDTYQPRGLNTYFVVFSKEIGTDEQGNPTNVRSILLNEREDDVGVGYFIADIKGILSAHPEVTTIQVEIPHSYLFKEVEV